MPRPGRHAAPRDLARLRAVLLPAVLLATSGSALVGMAVLPAAADDRGRPPLPAAADADLDVPLPVVAGADVDVPLPTALQDRAARGVRAAAAARAAEARAAEAARAAQVRATTAARAKERASRARRAAAAAAPAPRPEVARPGAGALTSRYGSRWGRLHAGIGLAAGIGSPVVAAADGTVVTAGEEGGYGRVVRLQHGHGTVTVYAHLSEVLVEVGQAVQAGSPIAREGNSGHSTGPHLHFEVRVGGVPVDPVPWLRERGVGL